LSGFDGLRKKMSIGITQLIILIVIGILLFGNLPKILKDVGSGIVALKKEVSKDESSKNSSSNTQLEKKTLETAVKTEPLVKDASAKPSGNMGHETESKEPLPKA